MDSETVQIVARFAENLSTVAVLLMAWVLERRRADRLEAKLIVRQDIEDAKEP